MELFHGPDFATGGQVVDSAEALFEEHREALRWEWIAGHAHPDRRFDGEVATVDSRVDPVTRAVAVILLGMSLASWWRFKDGRLAH